MKNVSDIYPLSPMQELMLVHALSRPGTDLLFNQVVYTLEGDLDAAVYERCWGDLVQRHPMLRTLFLWEGLKAAVQVVRETAELDWQSHDWRGLSDDEQRARLSALLQEDRKRGFDLNRAPLMRFILCQRADDRYTLVWSSHHLILDRWCIGILMNEIAALYTAQRSGISARLETRRSFRDYIRWLGQQSTESAESYWRAELAGITQPAQLGGEPSAGMEGQVGEHKHTLDAAATARLRRFASEHRLTLGTVVMGAWALLHGQANPPGDLLLGVTISGRPPALPGVEGMIGPFINNVPLRVGFPTDQPVAAWLSALQERQQAIQTYGYISPLQLQEWSQIEQSALYETLFLYQAPVRMPALSFDMRAESATLQTNVPLTLSAADEPDGLQLWFTYHQARYTADVVMGLREGMVRALNLIASAPSAAPDELVNQLRAALPAMTHLVVRAQAAVTSPVERQAPRNGLEARLFNLWANVLGHQAFGVGDNFFDLGASSFQAVQLISRMRQTFERELPVATLFTAPTIEQLAKLLSDGAPLPAWSSLVPIKPSGRKTPLFLVHHGGGGLFGYGDVARHLDSERPLYGLQEPGIENGQDLPTSVEQIASLYVREMQSVQPHGPYHVGGFCFGGVVAFEIAQQLRRVGETVASVVLLDAIPPGYAPAPNLQERLARHQSRMANASLPQKLMYLAGRVVRRARWEVQLRYMKSRRMVEHLTFDLLERANRPVPSELRQRRLLELNGQLNDAYTPDAYAGRAILIRGTYPEMHYAEDFGWNAMIKPEVTVFQMETEDHLRMLAEPHIHTLIQHLQVALNPAEPLTADFASSSQSTADQSISA